MQTTPGPEWYNTLMKLVDICLKHEDAAIRVDAEGLALYDGLIKSLLPQLIDMNAPLSLLNELLAGARAKRDLEKERQKVQELETKLREKEYVYELKA